jgi:NADH-quinone oxidoreductase subunit N
MTPFAAAPLDPLLDPAALSGAIALLIPEAALVGAACVLFLAGAFVRGRALAGFCTAIALLGAGVLAVTLAPSEAAALQELGTGGLLTSPIDPSGAASLGRWLALIAGALGLLVAGKDLTRDNAFDYLGCGLVMIAGTSLVARANDLVGLYLALEMLSVPTYVLLYLPSQSKAAQEAAIKYFLLSLLSSGMLLFGFSYLYGVTGSTNLTAIVGTLRNAAALGEVSTLAVLAMVLTIVGLAFRFTAVPFHYYAPDVYQGGPTGTVSLLAVLPKIAGFVALLRVLGQFGPAAAEQAFGTPTQIPLMLWVMAAITMTLGNVAALVQDNLKRMLAYSGVAHAGYMLIGIVAVSAGGGTEGVQALMLYLAAYALMTFAAFAAIAYLQAPDRPVELIDDLAGVGQSHPLLAGSLGIALLSLIGLPLTAGFMGKFMLFVSAFQAPNGKDTLGDLSVILVLIGAINAAIGAVYYLRVLGVLYLRSPLRPSEGPGTAANYGPLLAAVLCAVGTIALGCYPKLVTDTIRIAFTR